MSATNQEGRLKAIETALHIMGEHFDAVQIMATTLDEGCTVSSFRGSGNWYARQGLAHEFINNEVAQENAIALAEKIKPDPED